jgi:hypothetical protein
VQARGKIGQPVAHVVFVRPKVVEDARQQPVKKEYRFM